MSSRYRHFIRRGGLTVSGGEPLMQPAFVRAIFEEAKAAGIHIRARHLRLFGRSRG